MDPTSELTRYEEKVRHQEADGEGHGRGQLVVPRGPVRAARRCDASESDVDTRLAALKGKALPSGAPALSSGGTGA